MPTLFISYKRGTTVVAPLMEKLKEAGYRLWFDKEEIKLGENDWRACIDRGLAECDGVILNITEAACQKPEQIKYEVQKALALNKPIFAIILEDAVSPQRAIEALGLPERIQLEKFSETEGWSKYIEKLLSGLEAKGLRVTRHDRRKERNMQEYTLHQRLLTPEKSIEYTPEPRKEPVAFTHFYPSIISLLEEIPLHIYVHLPSALGQVLKNFYEKSTFKTKEQRKTEVATEFFERGTKFNIVPFVADCKISPSSAEITWEEDFEQTVFSIKPRKNAVTRTQLTGEVRIYVGPVIVATLPIDLQLEDNPKEIPNDFKSATRQQYERIFVSYSRDDLAVVKAIDKLCTEHKKIELLIDYKFLQGGDYWWSAIQEKISCSDAFQLFWSKSAAKSKNVKDEWLYALNYPKPILPVIFGRPRPRKPNELKAIHFEEFDQYISKI